MEKCKGDQMACGTCCYSSMVILWYN